MTRRIYRILSLFLITLLLGCDTELTSIEPNPSDLAQQEAFEKKMDD